MTVTGFIERLAISHRLRSASTLVPLSMVVAIAGVIGAIGSPPTRTMITGFLINLILVVALYLFVGNSGVFSFGHVAFMAVGAYTVGMVRIPATTKAALFPGLPELQLGPVSAVLLGAAVAALVALVIGAPLMRLAGLVAGLATFGLLNITYIVSSNLYRYTGGSTGMAGVPQTTTPLSAAVWALAILVVAWAYGRTRTCLRLRASREDEVAAQSIGIGIGSARLAAFVLSAAIAGVSGGLFAQFFGTFNPEAFFLKTTFAIVAMLVVGGAHSLSGAVAGAVAITVITETLRMLERGVEVGSLSLDVRPGFQNLGVATAMLLILILRPSGITGGREISLRWPTRAGRVAKGDSR